MYNFVIKMSEKKESIFPLTDKNLIEKTKNGDNSAFEELVKKYEQKIYNLALRLTSNPEEAGDILQETFLKAYRSLNSFKGEANFSTWLYRIAMNIALMRKRKEKGKIFESLDRILPTAEGELHKEIPDWSTNPEAEIENKEVRNILTNALASLPDDYRAVLVLRDIQNLSNKEVSEILKLSIPTVKSRLHRARLFLRNEVSKYFA